MKGRFTIRSVHRLTLSKCLAALLLALSIVPFTAPFAAFDIAEMLGDQPFQAMDGSALKLAKDAAAVGGVPQGLFTPDRRVTLHTTSLPQGVERRSLRSVVLRV